MASIFCLLLLHTATSAAATAMLSSGPRTWTHRHLLCRSKDDKHAQSVCREAPYLTYVQGELRNAAAWNGTSHAAFKRTMLQAIANLYDDLDVRAAPYVVCVKPGGCDRSRPVTTKDVTPTSPLGKDFVVMHPISFAVPERFIAHKVPQKKQAFGRVMPGNTSTYFQGHEEAQYRQDMSASYYVITYRKAGYDCLRHVEILAAGALPVFTDIAGCHPKALALHPRELYAAILTTPGLEVVDAASFPHHDFKKIQMDLGMLDESLYMATTAALLQYTRSVLSTTAVASYVFNAVRVRTAEMTGSDSALSAPLPSSVLYLVNNNSESLAHGDFMVDLVLHGMKVLLGDDAVVDFPRNPVLYQTADYLREDKYFQRKSAMYGKGYTFGLELEDFKGPRGSTDEASRRPGGRTYEEVRQALVAGSYDLVVLAGVHQEQGTIEILDTVCASVPKHKVVWIEGGDVSDWKLDGAAITASAACAGHLFSREGPKKDLVL